MKDNMFMVAGEITVVGKHLHETVMRGVAQNIGIDSFINDSNRVDNKGLQYQDCEVLFHVNKQSPDTTGGVQVGKDDLDDGAQENHCLGSSAPWGLNISHGSLVFLLKWMSRCLRAGWHRVNECRSIGSTSSSMSTTNSTNHNNRQSRQCKQEKEGKEKRGRKVRKKEKGVREDGKLRKEGTKRSRRT